MKRIILLLPVLFSCSDDDIVFKDYSLEYIMQLLDNMEPQYYGTVYIPNSIGSIEIQNNRDEGVYVTSPFIIRAGSIDRSGLRLISEIEINNGLYSTETEFKKDYIAANSSKKIQYSCAVLSAPLTDTAYVYAALLTENEYNIASSIIGKYVNEPNDLYLLPDDVLRKLFAYIAPNIIKLEYSIIKYIGTPYKIPH